MLSNHNCLIFSWPAGIRTLDPLIKSQLLYQLSYGPHLAANKLKYPEFWKQMAI